MDQISDKKCSEDNWINDISIKQALADLPSREKTIIMLRYYLGKTQVEISSIMGISQAQVSRLEKSALAFMRYYID